PGLERRLKGRDQRLKLGARQAGAMQERRGAGLQSGTADTSHAWYLLAWEAQEIINRDHLNYVDEMLHGDLYRWTPLRGWDLRWYPCILSSKATTRASEKSQQHVRHHCPILSDTTTPAHRLVHGTPAGAQRGHREDPGEAQAAATERSLWTHPPTPS